MNATRYASSIDVKPFPSQPGLVPDPPVGVQVERKRWLGGLAEECPVGYDDPRFEGVIVGYVVIVFALAFLAGLAWIVTAVI